MKHHLTLKRTNLTLLGLSLLCAASEAVAQSSFTITTTTADAFVVTGSASNPLGSNLTGLNFGGAGTLAIAPASSTKGEFDSVIMFNTAAAVSQFNSTYGAGNWVVTGLTLSLASNFGVQGAQPNNAVFNTINAGSFGVDWLANDSWVEGTAGGNGSPGYPNNSAVSFDSIPGLLAPGYDSLGTYAYTPPGNNLYQNYSLQLDAGLVSDATAGGNVSLYFYAADNQVSYLFNARSYASNHPELTFTVMAVPEPSTLAMVACGFAGLVAVRRWKNK